MARTIFKTEEPVVLEGYQAVLKPSKFGYSLNAIVGQDVVDQLETDRPGSLAWAESKLKNPKRSTLKPEPWEEVAQGKYKIKFSWKDETKPVIVDTEGTVITDDNIPVYSGSKVKLAFTKSLTSSKTMSPMAQASSLSVYRLSRFHLKLALMSVIWKAQTWLHCLVH